LTQLADQIRQKLTQLAIIACLIWSANCCPPGNRPTPDERIRSEALARQATARERLAEAVKDLLLEVALADADALLVQQATPAQKSLFGSAVGWLDNQVAGMVPGHLRPRSVLENNTAPMSRTF
jgi:hypothetical protein